MTTGAMVQGRTLASTFALIAATACHSETASTPLAEKAPALSAQSADAGVEAASDAGGSEPAAPPADAAAGDAGAGEPGVYLLSKFVELEDGALVTHFDTASATHPAQLAAFDPSLAGFQAADAQLLVAHGSTVFVTDAVSPVIRRYDLDAAGRLVPGPSLSFASLGVPFVVGWQMTVVSDTKAYFFDLETERAYAWNPATMQLTGASLDFSIGGREGWNFSLAPRDARLRGDVLFVPAYWYEETDGFSMRSSAAVVIDTVRDRILQIAEDERCAAFSLVPHPSGDLYAFPDGFWAREFYLDLPAPRRPLCGLRIRSGTVGYDPNFVLDLGALVGGGAISGGAVQGGFADGSGGIYISVADEQRYLDGEENVFQLWRWDVDSGVAEVVPNAPHWNSYMGSNTNAGAVFAILPGDETTTVLELSRKPVVPFELTGWIEPIVRLR